MIFSTNFLNKAARLFGAVLLCGLTGCGAVKAPVAAPLPALDPEPVAGPVVVLPLNNLSAVEAPYRKIDAWVDHALNRRGIKTVGPERLENFLARYRVRYTGGLEPKVIDRIQSELEASKVLLVSLELYSERFPPKVALTARLVSTDPYPRVIWADGIGLSGDDEPGLLGLTLVNNPYKLLNNAVDYLADSLQRVLVDPKGQANPTGIKDRFHPSVFFRSPSFEPTNTYRLAVLPFFNLSDRKYAGEIMALQYINQLAPHKNFDLLDTGVIRDALLNSRIIMNDGISLADADALFSRLEADLIVTGTVITYQDYEGSGGSPIVEFTTLVIEKQSREVVWSSRSHQQGDDLVVFFDWKKVNTAHGLASAMVRDTVSILLE